MSIKEKILEDALNDGLSRDDHDFKLHFYREDEDFIVDVYDKQDEFYARIQSHNFKDALNHALHYSDPMLASLIFGSDFFDWVEKHKFEGVKDED